MDANKLIDLNITKVAFVDEGDNPAANILLFKRKDIEPPSGGDDLSIEEESILGKLAKALAKIFKAAEIPDDKPKNKDGNDEKDGDIGDEPEGDNGGGEAKIPDDDKIDAANKGGKVSKEKEGEYIDMARIDKSKLTAEELAQLEAIEKKALINDEPEPAKDPEPNKVNKGNGTGTQEENGGDIYKGMHPLVKAKLDALEKFKAQTEEKELLGIAKRYEVLGEKPEELVEKLKSLKAAGGTAFNDMIAILDATKKTVEKSGIFKEIGKSGHGEDDGKSAVAKAKAAAAEIKKASPELTDEQAMAKAWENDPGLWEQYDSEMRGED